MDPLHRLPPVLLLNVTEIAPHVLLSDRISLECHAALRRWPEDEELLARLSEEAAAEFLLSGQLFD